MTNIMIPSESITAGQIGKIQEDLGAALRKSGLLRDSVQTVIEHQSAELNAEIVALVRKRVEANATMIVRHVRVNRSRNPNQIIDNTGCTRGCIEDNVVIAMPGRELLSKGEKEVDVWFFDLDYDPTPKELDQEYRLRGLTPDPVAQAQVNTDDKAFADERPNGCQWRDSEGKACYAIFISWRGERGISVYCSGLRRDRSCRFGGVRK